MPGLFETGDNPFSGFLDTTPQAGFFSAFQPQSQTPNQRRYFQNQFQNIHNEFLGALGSQIRQGQDPTLRFPDFLGGSTGAPTLDQRFRQAAPQERGIFDAPFAPPTRFIFGF